MYISIQLLSELFYPRIPRIPCLYNSAHRKKKNIIWRLYTHQNSRQQICIQCKQCIQFARIISSISAKWNNRIRAHTAYKQCTYIYIHMESYVFAIYFVKHNLIFLQFFSSPSHCRVFLFNLHCLVIWQLREMSCTLFESDGGALCILADRTFLSRVHCTHFQIAHAKCNVRNFQCLACMFVCSTLYTNICFF